MILIAAGWILVLLAGGGFALDRVLVSAVTQNFDDRQASTSFTVMPRARRMRLSTIIALRTERTPRSTWARTSSTVTPVTAA